MDSVCACICCRSGVALCCKKLIVGILEERSLAVFEDRCLFRAVIGEIGNGDVVQCSLVRSFLILDVDLHTVVGHGELPRGVGLLLSFYGIALFVMSCNNVRTISIHICLLLTGIRTAVAVIVIKDSSCIISTLIQLYIRTEGQRAAVSSAAGTDIIFHTILLSQSTVITFCGCQCSAVDGHRSADGCATGTSSIISAPISDCNTTSISACSCQCSAVDSHCAADGCAAGTSITLWHG